MRKAWLTALALVLAVSVTGCSKQTRINSYVLPGGVLGGEVAKNVAAVENIIVWPLVNNASGGKAKGVEVALTDYLVDTMYLDNSFKSVFIVSQDEAKDLMARTGEELGLKKKPKEPTEGALIMTKIGQLTGTEAILIGRIDVFDEPKVDKATYSMVSVSFFLYDAREQAYAALDSFTPIRTLWRTNAFRTAKETPFQGRASLYDTSRALVGKLVARLERDMATGTATMRKRQTEKIKSIKKTAAKQRKDGKYDEAVATMNEILKIDPDSTDAQKTIEDIKAEKKEAADRAKAREQAEKAKALSGEAQELEKAGDLAEAKSKWEEVLKMDAANRKAAASVKSIGEKLDAAAATEAEQEKAKNLHLAQQALGDRKYTEAVSAARKVLAVDAGNKKAREIIEAAEQKLQEQRAAEKDMEPAPSPVESAPPPASEPAPEPAAAEPTPEPAAAEPTPEPAAAESAPAPSSGGGGDVEALRNQAMEYFNGEDYENAEKAWKELLSAVPDDKQAQEMLETTQMLIEALK